MARRVQGMLARWQRALLLVALAGSCFLVSAVDVRNTLASRLRQRAAAPNLQDMKSALDQLQDSIEQTDAIVASALAGAKAPPLSPTPQISLSPAVGASSSSSGADKLRFHGASAGTAALGPENVSCESPCPASVQCGSCGSSCPCCCRSPPRELGPLHPVKTARDLSSFAPCASPCPAGISCDQCDKGGDCHCCCHPSNSHLRAIHEHDEDNSPLSQGTAPCTTDCPPRTANWTFSQGPSTTIVTPHTVLKLESADGEDPVITPYITRANATVPPGLLGADGRRIIRPHLLTTPLYDDEEEDPPAGKVRPRIAADEESGPRRHRRRRHHRHERRRRDDDEDEEDNRQEPRDRQHERRSDEIVAPQTHLNTNAAPVNETADNAVLANQRPASGAGGYPGTHPVYRIVSPCAEGTPCESDAFASPSEPPMEPSVQPPFPVAAPLPPKPNYAPRSDDDGEARFMPLGTVSEASIIAADGEGLEAIPLPNMGLTASRMMVPAMPLPNRDDSVIGQHRRYLQQWESGFA